MKTFTAIYDGAIYTVSIRMIAKELYRLQRETEKIEEELKIAPPEQKATLEDLLRKSKAELERMQNMLDGAKEPPAYRRPL